jgi:hypothetical protein
MSNAYRKEAPQQTQPQAAPTEAEVLEVYSAAVDSLYLAKGGDLLDDQISVAHANVRLALKCRQAELARIEKDANAMREKGDRPLVTVSEDRMHSRELSRLREERETLRLWCRNSLHDAIKRAGPKTLDDMRKVLNTAIKDLDGIGNMLRAQAIEDAAIQPRDVSKLEQEVARMAQVLTKAGETFMAMHAAKLTPELRQACTQALQSRDLDTLYKTFEQLPNELRSMFEQEVNAVMKAG